MPYQGPPGVRRGLRKIAVEHTRPETFDEGPNYDPDSGHPLLPGLPGGRYVEQVPHVGGETKPIDSPTPFKLGK